MTALCPGPVITEFQARAGIPEGYFPSFLARSAQRVARDGYDGLMRGRRVVVPGSVNKIAALLPRLLPRAWVLAIMQPAGARGRTNGTHFPEKMAGPLCFTKPRFSG